jgi:hypothetical protein
VENDVNDPPPVGENDIDLFAAMMNTGMFQPHAPATTEAASSTPPNISRRSAPESASRPPQSPSSGQPASPTGADTGLEQQTPGAESTDAELLTLLNLPPTTPVIRQASSEAAVARASDPAPRHESSHRDIPPGFITPPVNDDMDDWGSIQREVSADEGTSSVSGGEGGEAPADVNVDKLARDVLDVLRQRLRVEQERRGGKL